MKGWFTEIVDSSWIEALGGLSRCEILSVPPCFWANVGAAAIVKATKAAAATAKRVRINYSSQTLSRYRPIVLPVARRLAHRLQRPRANATI